jgi:hypothetical protein
MRQSELDRAGLSKLVPSRRFVRVGRDDRIQAEAIVRFRRWRTRLHAEDRHVGVLRVRAGE